MEDAIPPDPGSTDTVSGPPAAPRSAPQGRSIWPWGGAGRKRRARLTFEVPRVPETTDAWLHVVSGASPVTVARGALELAARFLSRGQRVLIVDGGPRLHLHDRFDREARWGVIECLTGEMPVLGLVQDVGRLGLYLLAHGIPARRTHWPQLGRLMDEARPHFGRAVLALDAEAPAAIGQALAGWHLEGWWAERGRATRRATRLADRLGIHLSDLALEAMPDAKLAALDARLWTLKALVASVEAPPTPAAGRSPVAAAVAPEVVAPAAAAPTVVAPAVATTLDCDPQVRERLRFLLWMRRIQTEGQPPAPAPPPMAATVPSA